MEYFTVLTNIGAQKIAAATAANSTINLSEIAVGDGNGVVPVPDISQEALVNEKFRAPLSELTQDKVNKNHFIARSLVPADNGNFWIREIGIYDVDGDLIAVGNYPETYKSILTDGAAKEVDLIVVFEVANADVVNLVIDPTVVMASQDYVNQKVATKADKTYVDEELSKLSFQTGFKNLIINGCLRVNERGGASIDEVAGKYNIDRWYYDGTNFIQFVEDKNVVLSGIYTLSWVGTATAKIDGVSVLNGGQVTLTENTQVEVRFDSKDFKLVQLEYGSKKTNFEIRPFGFELSLTDRYYEKFEKYRYGQDKEGGANHDMYTGMNFSTKRVTPAFSYGSLTDTSGASIAWSITPVSNKSAIIYLYTGTNMEAWVSFDYIELDAEIYPI